MKYFDKANNIFRLEQNYDEHGKPMYVEYTDEQLNSLYACDAFHYVGQDPVTGLPVQLENHRIKADKDFWRRRRAQLCFSVVNRGQVWYDTLSDIQKAELRAWYLDWLNVTETLREPTPPSWLDVPRR